MSDRGVTILTPIITVMAIALGYSTARIVELRAQVEVQELALRGLGARPDQHRRRLRIVR